MTVSAPISNNAATVSLSLFPCQQSRHHDATGEYDCSDNSDELDCRTVYWENKAAYTANLPPGPEQGDRLVVNITAVVVSVLGLRELAGEWQPKVP